MKRLFDILFATIGLMVLLPVLLIIAFAIKCTDGGSALFRQTRVGQHGRPFKILKFRTMVPDADRIGSAVTARGDHRVTRIGRLLRKSKLDELPQLINVLKGDMSLVGPRPEVPKYVALYDAQERAVLNLKPGITDLATLAFRKEEELLASADDIEEAYRQRCLHQKLALNLQYAATANVWTDVCIIFQTILPRLFPLTIEINRTEKLNEFHHESNRK